MEKIKFWTVFEAVKPDAKDLTNLETIPDKKNKIVYSNVMLLIKRFKSP